MAASKGSASGGSSVFAALHGRKTSAEIISEAKAAISQANSQNHKNSNFAMGSIRPIKTQRPFTPKDKDRVFFGRRTQVRPPSSISLKSLEIDGAGFINRQEFTDEFEFGKRVLKLPSIYNKKLNKNASLENLQEESPTVEKRKNFSPPPAEPTANKTKTIDSPQNSARTILDDNLENLFENKQIIANSDGLFERKGYLSQTKSPTNALPKSPQSNKTNEEFEKLYSTLAKLNDMNAEGDDETLMKTINELYHSIEKYEFFGNKLNSKVKVDILKCLYKYVENSNDEILLLIAKVILSMRVTGNNFSGVCKLVFKVSRNDRSDSLFLKNSIIDLFVDALSRSSPIDDAEACIYAYGAIKFLTMNANLLDKFNDLGILELMVLHMKLINNVKSEKSNISEQISHALYQLTGAVRNLASDETALGSFVKSGAVAELCTTLELFSADVDIIGNISRTLSIISTNEECSEAITNVRGIYKTLTTIFDKYPGREEIIVRLGYSLGNLAANFDEARVWFYKENNSIESLLVILKIYVEKADEHIANTNTKPNGSVDDVLVKIIRIIANISMNPEVGSSLIEHYGSQILDVFLNVLPNKMIRDNDELILSILSTLNNLSYYYYPDSSSDIIHKKQIDIAQALLTFVESNNKECVVEAVSVLGNLSRSKAAREFIVQTGVYDSLMRILENEYGANLNACLGFSFLEDAELLRATAGVLVNLMSDSECRLQFRTRGGILLLVQLLNECGPLDWQLCSLVCQVVWNYGADATRPSDWFDNSVLQQLLCTLADYLDEEKLFGAENDHLLNSNEYLQWEEFANVATNLLEKVEHFIEKTVSISDDDQDLCGPAAAPKTVDTGTNISFSAW